MSEAETRVAEPSHTVPDGQPGIVWAQIHLDQLTGVLPGATEQGEEEEQPGRNVPRTWAAPTNLGALLPNEGMTRSGLLAMAERANSDDEIKALCWSILAWGEMRRTNRNSLLQKGGSDWLDLARDIHSGKPSRSEAFDRFTKLATEGKLKGMGPAYFTKLIYFLMPRGTEQKVGYIMDQWVACSINLLADRQVVLMNASTTWVQKKRDGLRPESSFTVSRLNDGERYENYCRHIEVLASHFGIAPDQTELLLMSKGGKEKADWRKYVIKHRQPPRERCGNQGEWANDVSRRG